MSLDLVDIPYWLRQPLPVGALKRHLYTLLGGVIFLSELSVFSTLLFYNA